MTPSQPKSSSPKSDISTKTPAASAQEFIQKLARGSKDLWSQRVWLLFAVPFAFACWKPLQNSFRNWGNPDSLLLYQILVPFAVALLIWQERVYLKALWQRLQVYPATDKRRRGNLIPIAAGCLIVLFGHLVYVDSFFGIGLLLILAGTIYYIYGSLMLKVLAAPLALLLLMVNPPDSLISNASRFAIKSTAFATSSFLSLLGQNAHVDLGRASIQFPNYFVQVTDPLNGANILIAVLFIAFICAWYQRRTPLYTLCFLVLSSVFTLLVHLVRVSLYAMMFLRSQQIANLLLHFNAWLFVLILSAVIIYAAQSMDIIALRSHIAAKQREKHGHSKKSMGKRLEQKLIDPIFNASDKGVMHLANHHRKFSKGLNAFFKKLFHGKKPKGRSPW